MANKNEHTVVITTVETVVVPNRALADFYVKLINDEGSAFIADWSPEEVGPYTNSTTAEIAIST